MSNPTKVKGERMTLNATLVKLFEREFEGKKYFKARVIDSLGEVFDINVQESLVSEKPEILGYTSVPVVMSLALTSGQFNRATPILVDLVK